MHVIYNKRTLNTLQNTIKDRKKIDCNSSGYSEAALCNCAQEATFKRGLPS